MTRGWAHWLLAALLSAPSAVVAQETLSEAAAREKARRASPGSGKGKSYTDDDLKRLPKGAATPEGSVESDPAASESGSDSTETPGPPGIEDWRAKVARAREEVRIREGVLNDLEAQIKELRGETLRSTRVGVVDRENVIAREIQALLTQVEEARTAIAEAKQALEDVIEEARVAGVPYSQLD